MLTPEERRARNDREAILATVRSIADNQSLLLQSLESLLGQIRQYQQAEENRRSTGESLKATEPPILQLKTELPESLVAEYRTNQDKAYSQQRWAFRVSYLTLMALIVYAWFTYGQWQASLGQGETLGVSLRQTGLALKLNRKSLELNSRQADAADKQTPAVIASAQAAKSAAATASNAFQVGNRPWVKVTHRIVKPLSFDFVGAAGPAATMTVEDTLDNVGPTVALNVLTWADVIPNDYEDTPSGLRIPSSKSAIARMNEWCGANRNSEQSRAIGSILFPHTPVVELSGMGPLMSKVHAAMERSPLKGKVSFVMVGCVCYRSSFEDSKLPNHQIRFIYDLGIPESWGGWMPFIAPNGTATDLRLIPTFRTFTAD